MLGLTFTNNGAHPFPSLCSQFHKAIPAKSLKIHNYIAQNATAQVISLAMMNILCNQLKKSQISSLFSWIFLAKGVLISGIVYYTSQLSVLSLFVNFMQLTQKFTPYITSWFSVHFKIHSSIDASSFSGKLYTIAGTLHNYPDQGTYPHFSDIAIDGSHSSCNHIIKGNFQRSSHMALDQHCKHNVD